MSDCNDLVSLLHQVQRAQAVQPIRLNLRYGLLDLRGALPVEISPHAPVLVVPGSTEPMQDVYFSSRDATLLHALDSMCGQGEIWFVQVHSPLCIDVYVELHPTTLFSASSVTAAKLTT